MIAVTNADIISLVEQAQVLRDIKLLRNDVRFSEQGIDSLGMFNILLLVGERYKLEIPDRDVPDMQTVDEIVRYLNRRFS
jgi:acyl carrier protein